MDLLVADFILKQWKHSVLETGLIATHPLMPFSEYHMPNYSDDIDSVEVPLLRMES